MKAVLTFFVLFGVIFLTSCSQESDWGVAVISSHDELIFSDANEQGYKGIIVLVGSDTLAINYQNLVRKICYLKLAFPEEDIRIDYLKVKKYGEKIYEPRFINLKP